MRGTLALIGIVLLLVVAAHVQREEAESDDADAQVAAATGSIDCRSPCAVASADAYADDVAP